MSGTKNKNHATLPRGGRRPGAGRPRLGDEKLIDLGVRLHQTTIRFFEDQAERKGIPRGQLMREVLEAYENRVSKRRK